MPRLTIISKEGGGQQPLRFTYKGTQVMVLPPLSSNAILAALMERLYGGGKENKIINDCLHEQLTATDDTERPKMEAYKAFIEERAEMKRHVEEWWEAHKTELNTTAQ